VPAEWVGRGGRLAATAVVDVLSAKKGHGGDESCRHPDAIWSHKAATTWIWRLWVVKLSHMVEAVCFLAAHNIWDLGLAYHAGGCGRAARPARTTRLHVNCAVSVDRRDNRRGRAVVKVGRSGVQERRAWLGKPFPYLLYIYVHAI
jgi:hypothetical protein